MLVSRPDSKAKAPKNAKQAPGVVIKIYHFFENITPKLTTSAFLFTRFGR
jgi:hypothetical protein